MEEITTIGLDITKSVFQVHAISATGTVVVLSAGMPGSQGVAIHFVNSTSRTGMAQLTGLRLNGWASPRLS